jgi:hypothetical protein
LFTPQWECRPQFGHWTTRKDTILKPSKYEDESIAQSGLSTPKAPSITALELVDGHYSTVGPATGEKSLTVEKPFP